MFNILWCAHSVKLLFHHGYRICSELLYLPSPKGGCCSISDDLSYSRRAFGKQFTLYIDTDHSDLLSIFILQYQFYYFFRLRHGPFDIKVFFRKKFPCSDFD